MRNILFVIAILGLLLPSKIVAQITEIAGPVGSEEFGAVVAVLSNGNYVVTDPMYDEGGVTNIGAVYLYNGATHNLISTLKGTLANDRIGSLGVIVLPNGNYIVKSHFCNNDSAQNVGAITFCNGNTGINGTVNTSNSLMGSSNNDGVGGGEVVVLPSNNFVITTPGWDNGSVAGVGAVTWASGTVGITGTINSSNSLIGSSSLDQIGLQGVHVLTNGNYVVRSSNWDNAGITNAGAVTWGNGNIGISGVVSSSNSLVGTTINDGVGNNAIISLSNGNYVVVSPLWDNGSTSNVGAVTWCNANTGLSGNINVGNSLIGSTSGDAVGIGSVIPLTNGNYVVRSYAWANAGATYAGAVTWGSGTTGITGLVSSSNSLIGTHVNDQIGAIVKPLSNGHYVVASEYWDNAAISNAGAVIWGNGTSGTNGVVSSSNAFVGTMAEDKVGTGIYTLSNGNYVIGSRFWNDSTGAVTWVNGSGSITGTTSVSNSLIGSTLNDEVGYAITPLPNGNYVVQSPSWDNGAIINVGAVTLCNGTGGTIGTVSSSNSLVGSTSLDRVGSVLPLVVLTNSNYVVNSPDWANAGITTAGAATWCSGTIAKTGFVSGSNSIVGDKMGDKVGMLTIALNNGNYIVSSYFWTNGRGAATWGNGTTGTTGVVSSSNSLTGSTLDDQVGKNIVPLTNGNYLVGSNLWDNGTVVNTGFWAWGNGATGTTGTVSSYNALIGSSPADGLGGIGSAVALDGGNYLIKSTVWDNGTVVNSGANTIGNGVTGTTGRISSCNSVLGSLPSYGLYFKHSYNSTYAYHIIGRRYESKINIFVSPVQSLAIHLDANTQYVSSNHTIEFIAENCRIIGTLVANGTSPASGNTTAKVWVESSQPATYVKRHYQIAPTTGSTGRVTLYFTQAEFNDFNNQSPPPNLLLPQNSTDAMGKSHVLVKKYGGISSDATGLPASYSGAVEMIDPLDSDIVWNASKNRWEISFEVTSFSGFFVQTPETPLQISLLFWEGENKGSYNLLQWKTLAEYGATKFEIERSNDGLYFSKIAEMQGKGINNSNYELKDKDLIENKYYYRLKYIDIDGNIQYAQTISLFSPQENAISVYPNPTQDKIYINADNRQQTVMLIDAIGKTCYQAQEVPQEIDLSPYPNGVYLLKINQKHIKIIKSN